VAVGDGRGRHRRGERCTLLVGPALRLVRHRTLWFSATPDRPGSRLPDATHPRVVTLAEVASTATGASFGVAVAHLDQRHEANPAASAGMLLDWMDPAVPWVVLGDLNAGPQSPTLQRLEAAGFRSALPPGAGGTAHRFTGATDGPRIDHVLVRGPWAIEAAGIRHLRPDGRLPSDHWPVVADLRLG
jgi:endonuclease/exonuclease/phosphatase family metal-dependent hydrolase